MLDVVDTLKPTVDGSAVVSAGDAAILDGNFALGASTRSSIWKVEYLKLDEPVQNLSEFPFVDVHLRQM